MAVTRANFDDTCRILQERGFLSPGKSLRLPDRMPRYDDELLMGIRFFRTCVQADPGLDNLTLRRSFFGRSEISKISFHNTDLTESSACWNDFIEVDFSGACLAKCDMRASRFISVNFASAQVDGVDFRHSSFEKCLFNGASLEAAILTHAQGKTLNLSPAQRQMISWCKGPGDQPGGG